MHQQILNATPYVSPPVLVYEYSDFLPLEKEHNLAPSIPLAYNTAPGLHPQPVATPWINFPHLHHLA